METSSVCNVPTPTSSGATLEPASTESQNARTNTSNTWDRMSSDARAEVLRKLRRENVRRRTFQRWPASAAADPDQLARAGFFYFNDGDRVQCAFCLGIIHRWDQGDVPMEQHRQHFPRCPFVLGLPVGNQALSDVLGESSESTSSSPPPFISGMRGVDVAGSSSMVANLRGAQPENFSPLKLKVVASPGTSLSTLGVEKYTLPATPTYQTLDSRIKTFSRWPRGLKQQPLTLAEAGLYYLGVSDEVKCFQCDGGLKGWEAEDDPWVEHAKWFPKCQHVRLVKGDEFIEDVRKRLAIRTQKEKHDSMAIALMGREPALSVLAMGFNFGDVKRAILQNLEKCGTGITDANTLASAAQKLASDRNWEYGASEPRPRRFHDSGYESLSSSGSSNSSQEHDVPAGATAAPPFSTIFETSSPMDEDEGLEQSTTKVPAAEASPPQEPEPPKVTVPESVDFLCKICMEKKLEIVFLPCGHLCSCHNCATSIKGCPICRQEILGFVRAYLS